MKFNWLFFPRWISLALLLYGFHDGFKGYVGSDVSFHDSQQLSSRAPRYLAKDNVCPGGSGWQYTGTGELSEADFSPTLGKSHLVRWKSRANASLARNNYPFDLTSSREHILFPDFKSGLARALWIGSPGSVGLLHHHVNQFQTVCLLPLSSSLSVSPSSPCPAPSTRTAAMFLYRILRHIIP